MTPTFVIVPVKGEWHLTRAFLTMMLDQDFDHLLIIDNGSDDDTPTEVRRWQREVDRRVHLKILDSPYFGIYYLWDQGFVWCRNQVRVSRGERFNVLISNNDIELPALGLVALEEALDDPEVWVSYPDYDAPWGDPTPRHREYLETRGVFGDGGMFGACFMLAGERLSWWRNGYGLITDQAYWWWYGDNHLAECIELAGGKQVRVVGLPVKHVNEGTAQHYPELYAKKLHDRGQWLTRHQRGYGVAP